MTLKAITAAIALTIVTSLSVADEKKGDVEMGKALFGTCAGCHGADAMGNAALMAPRLAGQFDWYIVTQLKNFKEGRRGTVKGDAGGAMMAPMASLLADEQAMYDVAAYLESLK